MTERHTCRSCIHWIAPINMPTDQREERFRYEMGVCRASIDEGDFTRNNTFADHTCDNHEEHA